MKEAIYSSEQKKFYLRDYDLGPLPSPYHVKLKVKWVGICGSDLHSMETNFLPELSLGHEWIGEVTEIGEKVSNLSVGEHVSSTVQIKCGYCDPCKNKIGECANKFSLAVNHGMLKEYAYLPEASLVKIPQPVSQASTLFEILAVAENVFEKTKTYLKPQQDVLVMGAGLLGLSVALVFKREGYRVTILETIAPRVKRAESIGVSARFLGEALMDKTMNDSQTFIVDATGDHLGGKGGWKYLDHFGKKNFKAIILAKYLDTMNLRTDRFFQKQASLEWIQGCTEDSLKAAIKNWKDQLPELEKILISHTYTLNDVNDAFDMAKNREHSARVILKLNT